MNLNDKAMSHGCVQSVGRHGRGRKNSVECTGFDWPSIRLARVFPLRSRMFSDIHEVVPEDELMYN